MGEYGGILELNDAVLAAAFSGTPTEFEDRYFRTTPVFQTGDERYAWLPRGVFLGQGHFLGGNVVEYDVYRVA